MHGYRDNNTNVKRRWLVWCLLIGVVIVAIIGLTGCITYPGTYIWEEVGDLCPTKSYTRQLSRHKRVDKIECYQEVRP